MSFDGQHLGALAFFAVLYGAGLWFVAFRLYRMVATGDARLEGELHRRSERPADYWIDVAWTAFSLCWLCWMAFTLAVRGSLDFSPSPLLAMIAAVPTMMVVRALVARFVNGDDRHFRRTWWAARYWSFILAMSAFVAYFLLVPRT